MYPHGVHFAQGRQSDGTILLDVNDDALGHIGRVVIRPSADVATHVQIQLMVVDDEWFQERVARMRSMAEEIAGIFRAEIQTTTRH